MTLGWTLASAIWMVSHEVLLSTCMVESIMICYLYHLWPWPILNSNDYMDKCWVLKTITISWTYWVVIMGVVWIIIECTYFSNKWPMWFWPTLWGECYMPHSRQWYNIYGYQVSKGYPLCEKSYKETGLTHGLIKWPMWYWPTFPRSWWQIPQDES